MLYDILASIAAHAFTMALVIAFWFGVAGIAILCGFERLQYRAFAILIGLDVLANAHLGGDKYQTISCRVGLSMQNGGWASRMWWPQWWKDHCARAVYQAVV